MNKALKVVLILVGVVFLVVAGLFGFAVGYPQYVSWSEKQEALTFPDFLAFNIEEWTWHQESARVQAPGGSQGSSIHTLRKVDLDQQTVIYAMLDDDGNLSASALFVVACEPGARIETSVRYSNGDPATLECVHVQDNKTGLAVTVRWSSGDQSDPYDIQWKENYDGFSVDVNFDYWDFTRLVQGLTLSKAK